MTVTVECPCGATMQVEDSSEISALHLLTQWHEVHGVHRITEGEYRIRMQTIHGRAGDA